MKETTLAVALSAVALVAGCGRNDEQKASAAGEFEIPRSLVTRMMDAHDRSRDRCLNITNDFDSSELVSLMTGELSLTNAEEIASRPRGKMKFCDDLLTAEQRQIWWPFDIEKFEAELESKLELSEEYGFRVKPEFAELAGGGVNDDGYVASNPTIRWVNAEIENWSIKVWDEQKDRLDDAQLQKLFGVEEAPEGMVAWMVNEEIAFVIQQRNGAWNSRDYMFVFCKDGESTGLVFSFDSFPGRKTAAAIFQLRTSAAGFNNVAVMMWEHQCDRMQMDPGIIKFFLEKAIRGGAPNAAENLEVLRAHIPEVFMTDDELNDDREEESK